MRKLCDTTPLARLFSFAISLYFLAACSSTNKPANKDDSSVKTPEEELATFQLEPGLKIQLVASEPMVQEPVFAVFDEDGKLWVAEMRGYMVDIEGHDETSRLGRISILEDIDGDGSMDKSTIYLDSLVLPRSIGLIKGGALISENKALWITQDTDGDFKADKKILLDSTYSSNGLVEHSDNGLLLNTDNWYYSVKSRLRYRLVNDEWVRDSTEFRGQWGVSHDDEGRLFYNYNWSQLHGDLVPPNYLSRNKNHKPSTGIDHGLTIDRRVYPIHPTPAVNRGYIPGTLDKDEKLVEFTAACSPLVLRSTLFPAEYYGNAFVCEPAGNLVKRNVVTENGLILSANDPHPGTEFLASTDDRFRPVNAMAGPDGALYIVDMYHGIIQDGKYATPYLKEKTLERRLDQPIHMGRIWRIVPEDGQPVKNQKLSSASSTELISLLSHPDGWQRDIAQRLLVERGDLSVVAGLIGVAKNAKTNLARFHALWTLEGLGQTNTDLLLSLLSDKSPLIQSSALRILEPIAEKNPGIQTKLETALLNSNQSADIKQVLQIALSASALTSNAAQQVLEEIAAKHSDSPLIRDAVMSSLEDQEFAFLQRLWKSPNWKDQSQPKEIFLEMLATSIVNKRDSKELGALLAMLNVNEAAFGWKEKTVLTGLAIQQSSTTKAGPIQLASAPAILTKPQVAVDPARLTSLNAMFEWPGHKVETVTQAAGNTLTEQEREAFALGRQNYLTTCAGCHGTDGAGISRFAPPLAGSEWVTGSDKRLALIILHGIEGPIEVAGKTYNTPEILPVMPAHSTLDDRSIATILTYIRNEWGNSASAVSGRFVGGTRVTSQGRVVPWTAAELNTHIEMLEQEEAKTKAQ
ncbi:c-type cytochrome [uncultured Imperialibacter sp.]|uniref:DUF7133 domain-containing protein n=1 Tax=uncultured Imperialibacter sp. TaxID=1672639 RepID=UPI0030D6E50A